MTTKQPIEIKGAFVHFGEGHKIALQKFPKCLEHAIGEFDIPAQNSGFDEYSTASLEETGARLTNGEIAGNTAARRFLASVLEWAGRSKGLIIMQIDRQPNPSREQIIRAIPKAAKHLRDGKLRAAIEEITRPEGLSISYGSKILRMLSPQTVGVYDNVLKKKLPYPYSPAGWIKFCDGCQKVVAELQKRGIKNSHPRRKGKKWFVADVEAVIFQYFRDMG